MLTHLEVWAPNMYPSEAEPLPPAAFQPPPPAWPEDPLDPPPPLHPKPLGGGGGLSGRPRATTSSLGTPAHTVDPQPPPGSRGAGGAFVTVDSSDSSQSKEGGGGGSTAAALGDRGPPSPSEPASEPLRPALNSRGAVVRGGTRGSARLHARCSKRGGGPLEWWAVPCVYRRTRLARRWRWVLQRRGAGLMPAGAVWLGVLAWPGPVPRLERQRSEGGSARRPRTRRARRPPAWLTLRGWLHGPEDLFDPPHDPVTQPELWDGGGV